MSDNTPYGNRNDEEIILTSNYSFFDMFAVIKEKISLPIKETLLLKAGALAMWVFNSTADPPVILKKKSGKLFLMDGLVRLILPHKPPTNLLTVFQLIDIIVSEEFQTKLPGKLSLFWKNQSGDGFIGSAESFLRKFAEKQGDTAYISKMVEVDRHDDLAKKRKVFTTFCCNYSHQKYNPPVFKFYSKTSISNPKAVFKTRNPNLIKQKMLPMQIDLKEGSDFDGLPRRKSQENSEGFIKVMSKKWPNEKLSNFNKPQNARIQETTQGLINFMEGTLRINVTQVIVKFSVDTHGKMYFIGMTDVFCTPKSQVLGEYISNKFDIGDGLICEIGEFYREVRSIDHGLLETAIHEVKWIKKEAKCICRGQFCNYVPENTVEESFKIKESVLEEFKKSDKDCIKIKQKDGDRFTVSKALLEKIGKNMPVINAILEIYNIVNLEAPRDEALSNMSANELVDQLNLGYDNEAPRAKHLMFKYKNEPVCAQCYNIVAFLKKRFDVRVRRDLVVPLKGHETSHFMLTTLNNIRRPGAKSQSS
jgi:hypothetical protein